jgi:hypothetical protein
MTRIKTGLATVALLLVAGAAAPVAAQARGYIGFGAGASIPIGDFADAAKTGWLGQVMGGVTSANGMLGGRIDGTYGQNSFKGTGFGKLKLLGVNADVVITPGKRPAKAHPYFLAGVGFYNAKAGGDGDTKLALNGGLGIQIHAGNRMDFYAEGRFISVRSEGGSTNFIPITIGLRFGGI